MIDERDLPETNEDYIIWADGTIATRFHLPEFTWMSDDYRVVKFGSEEWLTLTETLDT